MQLKWLGWPDSNPRLRESKSRALPLGDTPSQVARRMTQQTVAGLTGKKEKRENSGARTHDIQSHNLALYH